MFNGTAITISCQIRKLQGLSRIRFRKTGKGAPEDFHESAILKGGNCLLACANKTEPEFSFDQKDTVTLYSTTQFKNN